jgi:hypothetical protein
MSTQKLVSTAQTDYLRQMANGKGVTRADFQWGLNNGPVARMLDNLKVQVRGIPLPPLPRTHIVKTVINPHYPWPEAIRAGAPQTSPHSAVWALPSVGIHALDNEVLLLNMPLDTYSLDVVDQWNAGRLRPLSALQLLGVGENNMKLCRELGMEKFRIVSTQKHDPHQRHHYTLTYEGFCRCFDFEWRGSIGQPNDWFAFMIL